MGKIIAVFNHKGGVGKTTLVHNVGVALAQEGKKVLFIDADPQMNLTAAFHGLSDNIAYTTGDDAKKTTSLWAERLSEGTSIHQVLKEAMSGTFPLEEPTLPVKEENTGTISLLAGSVDLASLEIDVSLAIATKREIQGNQILRMQRAIQLISKDYDAILIDTPPNAGSAITAILVRLSDYLITPVSPTFFSLQAIDNLKIVFENWNKEFSWLTGFSDKVKFLGAVVQMAKRFSGGSNNSEFSASTRSWVETLNQRILPFHQWMLSVGKSITEEDWIKTFGVNSHPFIIETCCDFTPQLRGIAERAGVPVISLTQSLCDKHKPSGSTADISSNKKGQYYITFKKISEQYRGIAKNIIPILD